MPGKIREAKCVNPTLHFLKVSAQKNLFSLTRPSRKKCLGKFTPGKNYSLYCISRPRVAAQSNRIFRMPYNLFAAFPGHEQIEWRAEDGDHREPSQSTFFLFVKGYVENWVLEDYDYIFSPHVPDDDIETYYRTFGVIPPPPAPALEDDVERSDPRGSVSSTAEKPSEGKRAATEDRGTSPMSTAKSIELIPWTLPREELVPRPSSPSSVVNEDWKPAPEDIPTAIRLVRASSRVRVIKEAPPPRIETTRALSRPRIIRSFPAPSTRQGEAKLPASGTSAMIRALSRPRIAESCIEPPATEDGGATSASTVPVMIRASSRPRLVTTFPDPPATQKNATAESPRYVDHGDGEYIVEYGDNAGERGRSRTRDPLIIRSTSQVRKARDKTPFGVCRSSSRVRPVEIHAGWAECSAPWGADAPEDKYMVPTKRLQTRKAAAVLATSEMKRRQTGLPEDKEDRAAPSYASTQPLAGNMTKSELARLAAKKEAYSEKKTPDIKRKAADFLSGSSEMDTASVSHETASSSRRRVLPRRQTVGAAALNNAKRKAVRSTNKDVGRELAKKGRWPLGLPYNEKWTAEHLQAVWQEARSCPFWNAIGEVASRVLTEEGCDPGPLKMRVATTRWELYKKTGQREKGDKSVPEITRDYAMKFGEAKMRPIPRKPEFRGMEPRGRWSEPDEDSDDASEEGV